MQSGYLDVVVPARNPWGWARMGALHCDISVPPGCSPLWHQLPSRAYVSGRWGRGRFSHPVPAATHTAALSKLHNITLIQSGNPALGTMCRGFPQRKEENWKTKQFLVYWLKADVAASQQWKSRSYQAKIIVMSSNVWQGGKVPRIPNLVSSQPWTAPKYYIRDNNHIFAPVFCDLKSHLIQILQFISWGVPGTGQQGHGEITVNTTGVSCACSRGKFSFGRFQNTITVSSRV